MQKKQGPFSRELIFYAVTLILLVVAVLMLYTASRRPQASFLEVYQSFTAGEVRERRSAARKTMDAAEIERACTKLGARVLAAHNQKKAMDLLRDPLKWIGPPIGD